MLDAINDNDFLWRPVVRVQLQRQADVLELPASVDFKSFSVDF